RVAVQVQREVLPGMGAQVLRLHPYQGRPEDRPGRDGGGGLPRLAHPGGTPDRPPDRAPARARQGPAPPAGRASGLWRCRLAPRFAFMTGEARTQAVPARARPAGLPALRRCLVMGVVNVTPDSFSDGGAWLEPAAAVA